MTTASIAITTLPLILLLQKLRWSPCPPHNIRSQEFISSSSPVTVYIVVSFCIGYAGMGNPKAALESKAVVAVVLI